MLKKEGQGQPVQGLQGISHLFSHGSKESNLDEGEDTLNQTTVLNETTTNLKSKLGEGMKNAFNSI